MKTILLSFVLLFSSMVQATTCELVGIVAEATILTKQAGVSRKAVESKVVFDDPSVKKIVMAIISDAYNTPDVYDDSDKIKQAVNFIVNAKLICLEVRGE